MKQDIISLDKLKNISDNFDYNSLTEDEKDELYETLLFEQAQNRRDFIELVDNLGWQIAENICLILFFTQYRSNCKTINHWKTELHAYCFKILAKN